MSYKFQVWGLREKIDNIREKDFIINQIEKLTIKIDDNLKYMNIFCSLKFSMRIKQFSKKFQKLQNM